MIPQTFTVTSEHIRFYFVVFLFYTFSCCFRADSCRGFRAQVKIASCIVSYRYRKMLKFRWFGLGLSLSLETNVWARSQCQLWFRRSMVDPGGGGDWDASSPTGTGGLQQFFAGEKYRYRCSLSDLLTA